MITSFFAAKNPRKVKSAKEDVPMMAPSSSSTSKTLKRERQNDDDPQDASKKSKEAPKTSASKSSIPEVQALLSHLHCKPSDDGTWSQALDKHFSTPGFARLAQFVAQERNSKVIFPPPEDTWSPLNLTPLDQVKVVIVGQDPYHGPNQAHGLCFSVRKGVRVPPSLRNVYKELVEDKKIENFDTKPTHGFLERWAKQGVLMINTVMTVRKGDANSHKKKGWEAVTDEIIRIVAERERGVIFLLWGKPAAAKAQSIVGSSKRHVVISTSHPSPLGATKTSSPFTGSGCFSLANAALNEMGYDEIDWRVDGEL